MNSKLITAVLFVIAVAHVIFDRLVLPALIIAFRAIEQSFAPQEPAPQLALAPAAEAPTKLEAVAKPAAPRKARRRKPSKQMLQKAEAALA